MTVDEEPRVVGELVRASGVDDDVLQAVVDSSGLIDEIRICGGRSIDLAGESDLVFCKAATAELLHSLRKSEALAVIGTEDVLKELSDDFLSPRVFLVSSRPRLLMARVLDQIRVDPGVVAQSMRVHPDARIAEGVILGPGAVVGADVEIGSGSVVGANTVIDHARIGECVTMGPNCSVGFEGFSFETDMQTGSVHRFPHFGQVLVRDRVFISANCAIARGSLRDTVIEDDAKLDNLVHVAHNCIVGRGAYLTANVMLAGSVTVGANCWLAPSTAVTNGATLSDHAMTGISAAVIGDVPENTVVVGVPAHRLRDRYGSSDPRPGQQHSGPLAGSRLPRERGNEQPGAIL